MGVGGKTVNKRPYKDLLELKKDPFKSVVGEMRSPHLNKRLTTLEKELLEVKHRVEKIESRSLS